MSGKGYSGGGLHRIVTAPPLLADEMVGRLARYLRFVGCDVTYVRGLSDDDVVRLARNEHRVILTRDRRLAEVAERSVLISSPNIAQQWRAVRAALPELPTEVRFDRCTACNGQLARVAVPEPAGGPESVPWDRVAAGLPLYRCTACAHLYWEGTHTESIRARIAEWSREGPP